ncbi:hypothetical protein OX284_006620 [Flavobacterium sp. SUN046]|uniref:hypothetical protein n=1 Tax=Flavobacterium sp. SUN046 TaxID=3002440 RepID=UPI002DBA0C54|nr:hypothetical protein [Flavobacterium sp. SUN046]MEC4049096.1 hypothetical protein [Flavobacterium sp. SUN046]
MQKKIDLPPIAKIVIAVAIGLPLALSIVCTLTESFPANYVIAYLTEEDRTFPLKAAILINWVLFMFAEFPLIIVIGLIKKMLFDKPSI